jgi:PrtD family type I secretion system ABC transporter
LEKFLQSSRRGLWLIGGLSLTTSLLVLALPVYSLQIFDRVLLSRSVDTLWVLTLGVVLALGVAAIVEGFRGQLLLRLSNRLALALDRQIFDELLQRATRRGDRSLQPMRDLNTVRGFIGAPQGLVALIDAPLVPLYLLVVYLLHPWMGHTMVIGAVLLIAIAWTNEKVTASSTRRALETVQESQQALEDVLGSADTVVAHGVSNEVFQHWRMKQNKALAAMSDAGTVGGQFASAAKGIRLHLNIALTAVGAYLAINDQITLGAMIAANILTSRALAPIELLIGATRQLIGVRLAWERLTGTSKSEQSREATRLPPARGQVEFEKVIYIPPGMDQPTIKGITFRIEAGSFLGLIGPSAAGKSTLARLACGVWEPKSGTVRLDGADIRVWHREDFGRSCGYLPQDVQLFGGTVRENICRFTDAGDDAVVDAARAAGAHEMILRFTNGYETLIGAGGARLSAGQRQRIGLARALFGDPQADRSGRAQFQPGLGRRAGSGRKPDSGQGARGNAGGDQPSPRGAGACRQLGRFG